MTLATGRSLGLMKSSRRSGQAGWVKSGAPATLGSTAKSPSKSCLPALPNTNREGGLNAIEGALRRILDEAKGSP
jgi:hypothetical protein